MQRRNLSRTLIGTALGLGLMLGTVPAALVSAAQPNESCETTGTRPGHAATAPGSAFNPDGTAGTKYAGEQPQNSRNPKSVSQYDVACARQP
jgi:hypothetical protein